MVESFRFRICSPADLVGRITQRMNSRITKTVLIFVMSCLLIAATSKLIVSPTDYPNSDFFSFWLSGRMLQSYQNPYEADGWVQAHYTYNAHWISDSTFLYPIPLAILFIPFGAFDLYSAFVAWVWLSQFLLLISIALLFPLLGNNRKHYIVPLALGILLYRPVIPLLVNGQLSSLFLLAIVAAGLLWERDQWVCGGVTLSVLFLKPSIGIPIVGLVGLYLLVRRQYSGLLGLATGGLALLVLGLLINLNWMGEYLDVLSSKQSETFGYSATAWGLSGLAVHFDQPYTVALGLLITVLGVLFFLFMLVRKRLPPLHGLALAVAVALFVTPYLWPYDQILLLLPMLLTIAALKDRGAPYIVNALVFLGVDIVGWFLFAWSTRIQIENPNSLLSLLILGLFAFTLSPNRDAITDDAK